MKIQFGYTLWASGHLGPLLRVAALYVLRRRLAWLSAYDLRLVVNCQRFQLGTSPRHVISINSPIKTCNTRGGGLGIKGVLRVSSNGI